MAQVDRPYTHYRLQEKRDFYQAVLIFIDAALAAMTDKVYDLGYFEVHITKWTPWDAWIEHQQKENKTI